MKTQTKSLYLRPLQTLYLIAMFLLSLSSCNKDNDRAEEVKPIPQIKISSNATVGNYLTDTDGATLYIFAKDVDGNSACEGGCLDAWPLFYEKDFLLADGLNSEDFGIIARADGKKQTTYKGWPLYRFANDGAAGDIKGEGVNKVWFVAKPDYNVLIAQKGDERYLVDSDGRTLYFFGNDTEDVSNCNGTFLENWPLFFNSAIDAPSMFDKSSFGTISRADGLQQITYRQMPLYYYKGDTNGAIPPELV